MAPSLDPASALTASPPPGVAAAPASTPAAELAPDSWAAFRARTYFSQMDGLRTLAMALVVWNHAGSGAVQFGAGLGVKLFFVISGFLIITLLLRERDKHGSISLKGFHVRRSLRILPLYFAVLGLYTLLVALMERGTPEGAEFFHNLPAYLTFTANWFVDYAGGVRVIFFFAWSLSAQEQFYLVWPSIVRLSRGWAFPVALMSVVLVVGLSAEWGVQSGRLDDSLLLVRLLARQPTAIGAGLLAAYLLHDEKGFAVARPLVGSRWSVLLGAGLMLLQAFQPSTPDVIPVLGATILVTSCAVRPDNVLTPLLDLRLMRHVGTVSLGIYLMHLLALNVARRLLPGSSHLAHFLVGFPLSALAATVSYRWFEQPVMRLRRYFQ